MKKIKDVCVIVQARLSSQRCPNKMIRPFADTTLTDLCIEKLLNSKVIPKENIVLSVHEPELVAIGEKHGVNIFRRSKKSAFWDGGEGSHIKDMYEWWDKIPFKYTVFVNACAPMLRTQTIDNFFVSYMNSESDGMFAVLPKKNYFWNSSGEMINEWPAREPCMNTKAVEKTFEAAHCLYASRLNTIGHGIWMGDFNVPGDIELVEMPEADAFDVDYEWEFQAYEAMYIQLKAQELI